MKYLLPLLLMFSACSLHRTGVANLPNTLHKQKPLYLTQRFEIVKGGKPFKFQGFAEFEGHRLAIVGLTPVGNRGFSAVYEGGQSSLDKMAFYRLPIKAEQLLGAYQIIYAGTEDLQALGFSVIEKDRQRKILRGTRLVAQVTYSHDDPYQGVANLSHISQQFTLAIQTQAVESL